MNIAVKLLGSDELHQVKVTELGELVTAPIEYSTPYYVGVEVLNTAYEVVPAKSSMRFVITALLLNSRKDFGSATVAQTLTIYEANPADIDTVINIVTQVDMLKNDRLPISGLNLVVPPALSLVAIADDSAVDVTVAGYYVNG